MYNDFLELYQLYDTNKREEYCRNLSYEDLKQLIEKYTKIAGIEAKVYELYRQIEEVEEETFKGGFGHSLKKLFSPKKAKQAEEDFRSAQQAQIDEIKMQLQEPEEKQKEMGYAVELYRMEREHVKQRMKQRFGTDITGDKIRKFTILVSTMEELAKLRDLFRDECKRRAGK